MKAMSNVRAQSSKKCQIIKFKSYGLFNTDEFDHVMNKGNFLESKKIPVFSLVFSFWHLDFGFHLAFEL
jgi:hypothetical protein